jgi:hypothetical protein
MDEMVNELTPEDKKLLEDAKTRANLARLTAEKALAQNQLAEVQMQNLLLQFCLKYKLDMNTDGIDDNGKINRRSVQG